MKPSKFERLVIVATFIGLCGLTVYGVSTGNGWLTTFTSPLALLTAFSIWRITRKP